MCFIYSKLVYLKRGININYGLKMVPETLPAFSLPDNPTRSVINLQYLWYSVLSLISSEATFQGNQSGTCSQN